MHEYLTSHRGVKQDSQENVVCNRKIETQGTRLERNQHDLGVHTVETRAVENLFHGWNRFHCALAFPFLLPFFRLALLYAGRDILFKVIVGVVSGDKVRVIAIGGILVIFDYIYLRLCLTPASRWKWFSWSRRFIGVKGNGELLQHLLSFSCG